MAKSKVKRKNPGFVIEGTLNYEDKVVEIEELGNYPFDKIFKDFEGKYIKITIDEPDEEILAIPED
jgi:hypothetical protein